LFQAIAVPKYVTIDSIDQLNDNADKLAADHRHRSPAAG